MSPLAKRVYAKPRRRSAEALDSDGDARDSEAPSRPSKKTQRRREDVDRQRRAQAGSEERKALQRFMLIVSSNKSRLRAKRDFRRYPRPRHSALVVSKKRSGIMGGRGEKRRDFTASHFARDLHHESTSRNNGSLFSFSSPYR